MSLSVDQLGAGAGREITRRRADRRTPASGQARPRDDEKRRLGGASKAKRGRWWLVFSPSSVSFGPASSPACPRGGSREAARYAKAACRRPGARQAFVCGKNPNAEAWENGVGDWHCRVVLHFADFAPSREAQAKQNGRRVTRRLGDSLRGKADREVSPDLRLPQKGVHAKPRSTRIFLPPMFLPIAREARSETRGDDKVRSAGVRGIGGGLRSSRERAKSTKDRTLPCSCVLSRSFAAKKQNQREPGGGSRRNRRDGARRLRVASSRGVKAVEAERRAMGTVGGWGANRRGPARGKLRSNRSRVRFWQRAMA